MAQEIIVSYVQKTVQDLENLFKSKSLDLEPGFQRQSVWQTKDRRKLIDSILHGYPLPSIFLYKKITDQGRVVYQVIDGKQRLETIFKFMGVISGEAFELKANFWNDTATELINWKILKKKSKQHLLTAYKLQTAEVEGDFGDIIKLFVLINSTGKALTGAEKRNAKFFKSEFLQKAGKLAEKFKKYFLATKIMSPAQISRMKHVELICELIVAAHNEGVTNKKASLDKAMEAKAFDGRSFPKSVKITIAALNRTKKLFPKINQTRFIKYSDYYSLIVLFQKFEREGYVLPSKRYQRFAWEVLQAFSDGVDSVTQLIKQGKGARPDQEVYRNYFTTVSSSTDEINHREQREKILCSLIEPFFVKKDKDRLFSEEQRRIIWNSTQQKKCKTCGIELNWSDFTIDHIRPYSKGGRSSLENAALMCRKHNSQKGNR
jgi:hypothetical protein